MENVKRNTAYKIWIANLLKANYFRGQEQFEAGYVEFGNNKISRVNIIGTIIDKFSNENSLSFNLDDGSGILKLRTWSENSNNFNDINVGDLVLLIGKVKEFNNFIYVTPEIIKKLDNPLWLKVRKNELIKLFGEVQRADNIPSFSNTEVSDEDMTMNVIEEKMGNIDNSRETILSLIEKLDFGDGADLEEVISKSGFTESRNLINELLMDGEIFELHKGKLRVID
ncbi:hypothetical protein HYU23_00520 [Candidatus Woesearchaeota archaeon]|nr:hypothetical protein [Candidatus Woesearchaeota archaeon]